MARPRKEVSWEEIDKLCGIQATEEEIAQWCEVSVSTLSRRCHEEQGMSFDEYYAQKKGTGKISLRRAQWQRAMKGNPTLLIWLGKQYLGQKDKSALEHTGADGKPIQTEAVGGMTDAELDAKLSEYASRVFPAAKPDTEGH